MKKTKLAMLTILSALVTQPVIANELGWMLFPVIDDNYIGDHILSITAGSFDPDSRLAGSGSITGIELSMNCPLVKPPTNNIRQQISYTVYDENNLKVSSFELNPHYVVALSNDLSIGGGPGIGYVSVDSASKDPNLWAFQLGGSIHYTGAGPLFIGAEARYQLTEDSAITATENNMDNMRAMIKLGYAF